MRHTLIRSAGLSPYAQALKHIALRGAGALQRTAAEDEQAMYRAGTLPMDYRPPRDSAWDDTIERWAYAWQYPISEQKERITVAVAKEEAGMAALTDAIQKLIEAPPSRLPGSSRTSQEWPCLEATATQGNITAASTSGNAQDQHNNDDAAHLSASPPLDMVAELAAETFGEAVVPTPTVVSSPASSNIKAAHVYSKETNIPVAYLDDGSELSQASRAVALVVTDQLGLPYNDYGIGVALFALARIKADPGHLAALFAFAKDVGLGPTAMQYSALCFAASLSGNSEHCIALIEEMKESGITPTQHTWHMLAKALHTSQDHAGALQVLDNMKSLVNLTPNEFDYALRLRCLGRDPERYGGSYEAVQVFDQMQNVDGVIPTRMLYTAYLEALSRSAVAEHRLRVVETGAKMEALGIPWDLTTYKLMLRSAAVTGDLARVEELCVKLRDEGLEMDTRCIGEVIAAHYRGLLPEVTNYADMEEKKQSVLAFILDRVETGMAIFDLGLKRGLQIDTSLLNRLLTLHCTAVTVAVDRLKDGDQQAVALLETAARKIWDSAFTEYSCDKDVYSYESFIKMLGALQRIDEAENLFTELVQDRDKKPTRGTYEALIVTHLSSGEEGATARALQYFEAMERVGHPIRPGAIRRMVQATDNAAYKRDMKRRARRIMQAREEYLARRAAEEAAAEAAREGGSTAAPGVGNVLGVFGGMEAPAAPRPEEPSATRDSADTALIPSETTTTLSWWDRWRKASINKHELFDTEREDGMPRGEDFAEKKEALRLMGIESRLTTPADVPGNRGYRSVLSTIREQEGSEPAGALFALDGGNLQYPTARSGPNSWAVAFWRERQIVKKELQKVRDGLVSPPPFSTTGIGARTSAEQVLIGRTGAKTPGELQDALAHPDHVYDDGRAKPASEFAAPPSPAGDLVWVAESRDKLAPYRTEAESVTFADDNEVLEKLRHDASEKTAQAIDAVRNRQENLVSIVGGGTSKKRKYDYLEHFRELYRQGTLEAPDEPLLSTGGKDDHRSAMAAHVKGWFDSQRRTPAAEPTVEKDHLLRKQDRDSAEARREQRHHSQKTQASHRAKHQQQSRRRQDE